jgi:long-subunit fatty acid transport protein
MRGKIILPAALIGFLSMSASAHAYEVGMGTIEISGDLDLSVLSAETKVSSGGFSDTTDNDTINLSLTGFYYLADNLGLGINWSYQSEKVSADGDSAKTTMHLIGPAVQFNSSLNDTVSLFLAGTLGYASIDYDDSFFGNTSANGFGYSISGGIKYFINDYISLNGSIGYGRTSVDIDDFDAEVEISGVNIGLGLSAYLP